MGLDVGSRRIGVALSDQGQILASPLTTVRQGTSTIGELRRIIDEHEVVGIVAGLPTGLSGREGAQASETRVFAEAAAVALERPLAYWDERLTSTQAERMLIDAGKTSKQRRGLIDALAASLMLQSYLDSRIYRRRRADSNRDRLPS